MVRLSPVSITTRTPSSARPASAAGVVSYELATGEIHVFQAKSVVFATGGAGKVYKTTSNAHTLTGDGMANAPYPPGTRVELRLLHVFEMRAGRIARETVFEGWTRLG